MEIERRHRIEYGLAILWLVFTISLATWWLIFGLRQASALREVNLTHSEELVEVHHMLFWEGGALIASLAAGGAGLLYGIRRERKRRAA